MKRKSVIIPSCLLLLLAAWAAWIMSPPQVVPLLDDRQSAILDGVMPHYDEQRNDIVVFDCYRAMLDSMKADIGRARHHVHLEFFKFEESEVGRELAQVMYAAARRGVEVRLLYDDFSNDGKAHALYDIMRQHGVEVAAYEPVVIPFFSKRDNLRNHRKIVVIDGCRSYVGGMNIADRYMNGVAWGEWRDLMIRITGTASTALQHTFVADWHYATDSLLRSPLYFPIPAEPHDVMQVEIVNSGANGYGAQYEQYLISLLNGSRRYAYFMSPYFIPTDEIMQALCEAAKRGVDVRLLQPKRGDNSETPLWASRSFYEEALEAGVRIGLHQDAYLHTKLVVVDDSVAVVGSSNLDVRSLRLNQEVMAAIADSAFARRMRQHFATEESASLYIDPDEWRQRPLGNKIREQLSRTIASQM